MREALKATTKGTAEDDQPGLQERQWIQFGQAAVQGRPAHSLMILPCASQNHPLNTAHPACKEIIN